MTEPVGRHSHDRSRITDSGNTETSALNTASSNGSANRKRLAGLQGHGSLRSSAHARLADDESDARRSRLRTSFTLRKADSAKALAPIGEQNIAGRIVAAKTSDHEQNVALLAAEFEHLQSDGPMMTRTVRDLSKHFGVSRHELATLLDALNAEIYSPRQIYRVVRSVIQTSGLSRPKRKLLLNASGTFLAATVRALAPLTLQNGHRNYGLAYAQDASAVVGSETVKRIAVLTRWTRLLRDIENGLLREATERVLLRGKPDSNNDTYNRITRGVDSAGKLLDNFVADILPLGTSVAFSEAVLAVLDLRMWLMSLISLPISHFAANRRISRLQKHEEASKKAQDRFKRNLELVSAGFKLLSTMPGAHRVVNLVKESGSRSVIEKRERDRNVVIGSLLDAYLPSNIGMVGTMIIGWAALGVSDGKLIAASSALAGSVFSLQQLLQKLYVEVPQGVSNVSQFMTFISAANIDQPDGPVIAANALKNRDIEFADAAFVTSNGSVVHKGINLTIRSAERLVIKGAIGVGKSTLIELIAGLATPSAGGLTIGGVSASQLGKGICLYAPQTPTFFPGTVLQNFMHYLSDDLIEAHGDSIRNDAERLLTQLGLDIGLLDMDAADLERERKVSGGQARVLSLIGPVLASQKAERAILLLDEPTSNLDEISAAKVATLLKTEVAPNATVVVVSHDKALDGFGSVLVMSKDEDGRTVLQAQESIENTAE